MSSAAVEQAPILRFLGATGTVTCKNASFPVTVDFFTLVVKVDANVAAGTVLTNTATLSTSTPDPNSGNDSATATTTVAASADLLLSKTDSPDPVNAGSNVSYQITITNNGPSNATPATFTDTLPAGTTFVSLSTTGTWSCTTPALGATGTEVATFCVPTLMQRFAIEHFDIVKLDIEGAEHDLFRDHRATWLDKVTLLLIEIHSTVAMRSVGDALAHAGFEMRRHRSVWYCARPGARVRLPPR